MSQTPSSPNDQHPCDAPPDPVNIDARVTNGETRGNQPEQKPDKPVSTARVVTTWVLFWINILVLIVIGPLTLYTRGRFEKSFEDHEVALPSITVRFLDAPGVLFILGPSLLICGLTAVVSTRKKLPGLALASQFIVMGMLFLYILSYALALLLPYRDLIRSLSTQ